MKEIVKGVVNHLLDNEVELSKTRMAICNKCEEKKEDIVFGPRCNKCGCILKFKTKSSSGCPLGKW